MTRAKSKPVTTLVLYLKLCFKYKTILFSFSNVLWDYKYLSTCLIPKCKFT